MYMYVSICAYHFGVCEFDFSLCVEVFLWLFLHLHYDVAMLDLLPLQWPVRIQLKAINNGTIQLILARLCLVPWTQAYVLYTAMINRDRGWVGSAGISHPWGWFENSTKVLKYVWCPPPTRSNDLSKFRARKFLQNAKHKYPWLHAVINDYKVKYIIVLYRWTWLCTEPCIGCVRSLSSRSN